MTWHGPGDGGKRKSPPKELSVDGVGGDFVTRTDEGEVLADLPQALKTFASGQVVGGRYQIREMLGRGGMGEVWRAHDLKLRVEVALKAPKPSLIRDRRRLELLRREVRAAREVVSPNVCRIFDLIEVDGRELVSMEYVDGQTLLNVLQERSPLELKEAQDIASQFLAGLDAIHQAGLVHRDVKPENIMLTRAGRVVVMDFGLARQVAEGSGSVSGTPAYMAPEQAALKTVDARADIYSAGVVLAEMVSPEGLKSIDSRKNVWEGVRSEPSQIAETPWEPVITKAVAMDPGDRHDSAHALTRALEDVTLRVDGAEDLRPYPGLASFTEDDSRYFFGREAEVEQMWRKLEEPPRMLALVGPSGAGKTSFLRAGLIPSTTDDWRTAICKPGNNPELALSRALAAELAGNAEAVRRLLRFDDPEVAVEIVSHWRRSDPHALLIVDQFEELFTQNSKAVQDRFSSLLVRIVLEADVHVVLSMRDDFLFRCHELPSLRPVFAELTPIGPPEGAALRRALVQPATTCGYRFEDDELVEGMLAEVEGERGALPLLAFAAARLWEKRDRHEGLLTRVAYDDIGGVGGAIARHAEGVMDRLGSNRHALVRELFSNFVTAEGTRAVWDAAELLSVVDESQRQAAGEVLRELIDARLVTSYEVQDGDQEPTRRVEIIHESLIESWPRLVRWRTQDADGVQLRDQLRQATRTWDEHDRSDDLLWTGTAYREYELWRERYPGGLTDTEEDFARAMTALATRRRRRRRIVAAAIIAVAAVVAAVTTTLWRRGVLQTRRAEAQKLIALGQLELDSYPTAALAYARASLEVHDTAEGRRLALEALWRGPPARILPVEQGDDNWGNFYRIAVSPDARWLATTNTSGQAVVYPWDGGPPSVFSHPLSTGPRGVFFGPDSATLAVDFEDLFIRSIPDGEVITRLQIGPLDSMLVRGDRMLVFTPTAPPAGEHEVRIDAWPLTGGDPETLGVFADDGVIAADVDSTRSWMAVVRNHRVFLRPLGMGFATTHEQPIGPDDEEIIGVNFTPRGDSLALATGSDESRGAIVWPMPGSSGVPVRVPEIEKPTIFSHPVIDPTGSLVAMVSSSAKSAYLWDLDGPPDLDHMVLRRSDTDFFMHAAFDGRGQWLATLHDSSISLWPLAGPRVRALRRKIEAGTWLSCSADGRWLAACALMDGFHLWPLNPGEGVSRSIDEVCFSMAAHPTRPAFAAGTWMNGPVHLVPLDGGPSSELISEVGGIVGGLSFDHEGRLFTVTSSYAKNPEDNLLKLFDLETGGVREFDQLTESVTNLSDWDPNTDVIYRTQFTPDGTLFSAGRGGLRRWDLESGGYSLVYEAELVRFDLSRDGKYLLAAGGEADIWYLARSELRLFNLASDSSRVITTHGGAVNAVAFDPSGSIIVTGDGEGVIRVGPVTGEEPHLLLRHTGRVTGLVVSPDGRWIYSAAGGEIRQWPMPDLSRPPLHTLPYGELMGKLEALTNLRVIPDLESPSGWSLDVGPFAGWQTAPEW